DVVPRADELVVAVEGRVRAWVAGSPERRRGRPVVGADEVAQGGVGEARVLRRDAGVEDADDDVLAGVIRAAELPPQAVRQSEVRRGVAVGAAERGVDRGRIGGIDGLGRELL